MDVSYEQFVACLPVQATRELIGLQLNEEKVAELLKNELALRAFYDLTFKSKVEGSTEPKLPAQISAPVPAPRTILDMEVHTKGASLGKIQVTTERLLIAVNEGTSAWKMLFGIATAGISLMATGINIGRQGEIDIPISLVSSAWTTKVGLAFSTMKLVIAGETLKFGIASYQCPTVVEAINSAISGGHRAQIAADAWEIQISGKRNIWLNERMSKKELKQGTLSQIDYNYRMEIAAALRKIV